MRKKSNKMFGAVTRTVDKETGEVVELEERFVRSVDREEFIKFYFSGSGIMLKLKDHEIRFIIALLPYIGYNNEILLTLEIKRRIAEVIKRSEQRVVDTITSLVKQGILARMSANHYLLLTEIAFRGEEVEKIKVFRRIVEIRINKDNKQKEDK